MSLPAPDLRATAAEELLGQTLSGRFRLDALLGHGSMGAVFKAYHLGLHKDVALKLLHRELTANDEMVARFDREAAAVSRLDHPNCVRIMDFGSTDDGRRYLVMEYLEGSDLADIAVEPMPPFRVVDLVRQILAGLQHAHAHGLVHRDIKHENIFVIAGDEGEQVKLLDFGIAKVTHGAGAGHLTQKGIIFGTPNFMSPEQAKGEKTDARSDLYSLGIVMHSMLAGELPFHGDNPVAILRRQIAEDPPKLPDAVPGSLRNFVMQLMAKNPDERFADATAAIAALRRAASPTEPSIEPETPPPPPKLGQRLEGLPRPKARTLDYAQGDALLTDEPAGSDAARKSSPAGAEGTDSELPELEELVALETDDDGATQSLNPPPPPAVAADAPSAAESDDAPAARASTTPPQRPWVLPAVGVGALGLLILTVAAWPDGDDPGGEPEAAAGTDAAVDEEADGQDQVIAERSPDAVVIDDENDPAPAGEEGEPEAQSKRALRATLASIDALIESQEYDAARITIGPLLEVYGDEAALHWRMGRVLVALGRKANATAALQSYRSALSLEPDLLDDEEFTATFWDLLDDPSHRELSTEIAVELLGDEGHERLARWVNVQENPLPYASRRAATQHLRAADQTKRINEPLQTALDLWQADTTAAPCDAFANALEAATADPDSYLLGSLSTVSVPQTGEGDEAAACPGLAEKLTRTRDDYARRYAGLDPAVPAEFRRRKSSNRRRRR